MNAIAASAASAASAATPNQLVNEFLSGLTIALLLIPESIAFAFIMGLAPNVGIQNTMVMSLITSLFGGMPTMISGSTAAVATSIAGVGTLVGKEYIIPTVIIGGVIQMLAAVTGLYKYVTYVPKHIMSGFLVALAGLIAVHQLDNFKDKEHKWLTGLKLANTTLFTIISTLIAFFGVVKITHSKDQHIHIPGGLVSMLAITAFIYIFTKYYNIDRVKDVGEIKSELPSLISLDGISPSKLKYDFEHLVKILPFSAAMAFTGLLESLIMVRDTESALGVKGDSYRESLIQGIANIATGLTGGFGGCVLVGQSKLNLFNGAKTQFSSVITSVLFIIICLFFGRAINEIPIAAVVGVMLLVVYKTGDWDSLFKPQSFDRRWVITIITAMIGFMSGSLSLGVVAGVVLDKMASRL
jgi:SulP family sulfate permease